MRNFSLPLIVVRCTPRNASNSMGCVWVPGRSRPTWPKTQIIPARVERVFYIGKKNSEKLTEFQKTALRRWVFYSGFFAVFRGSCLATLKKIQNVRKPQVFYASVNSSKVFDKVEKWSPDKIALEKHHLVLQRCENRQVTRFPVLISPIDCYYWLLVKNLT